MQKQEKSREERFAILGLVIVGICWGFEFLGLRYTDALPTLYIQSVRFAIAAAALALVFLEASALHHATAAQGCLRHRSADVLLLCLRHARHQVHDRRAHRLFLDPRRYLCADHQFHSFFAFGSQKSCFCVLLCVIGIYLISMTGGAEFGVQILATPSVCDAAFFWCRTGHCDRKRRQES